MVSADLLKRVDELLELGQKVLATKFKMEGDSPDYVDHGEMMGFRSATLSFLERIFGREQTYYLEFHRLATHGMKNSVEAGINILKAVRSEIAGGWLVTVKSLVSAEIFSDFLEMAEHLLSSEYKDPAAVVIGSVLEEHLRQLCNKHGIDLVHVVNGKTIPKMGDMLNADLSKASVYNKLDQKSVTAWLDLRNKAAHGKYHEYQKEQVELMYSGVTNFMSRVAA